MPSQPEHRELLVIAQWAADEAAALIREAAPRARALDWRAKAPTDFVSEVDLAAEARILEVIRRELPEATVLAEETASTTPPERLRTGLAVVVDPLDGTTNFLHGYPEYAVSIAVLAAGEPVAAVVVDVPAAESFTAVLGGGALAGEVPIRVSGIEDPQRALIATGFPFKDAADIPAYQVQMSNVMSQVSGVRRPGAASLDLAGVAAGRFDGFWENLLSPWDFAAGILLVREAGGVITDLAGGPLGATTPSSVVAGNPRMHEWLLRQV